jgi:glyoxylase-like metal-dependent hydrolase (beta-lactamase superfamily II)
MLPRRALKVTLLEVGHCRHPEWVTERGGRWGARCFPAVCALIEHPERGPLLFDTGYSAHFVSATQPFPERLFRWITPPTLPPEQALCTQLALHGWSPGDIHTVIASHLHADHIAGLRDLPAARCVVLKAELDTQLSRGRFGGLWRGFLRALLPDDFAARVQLADATPGVTLDARLAPFAQAFDLFDDGSVLGVPLPGHSPGQLGLLLRAAPDGQLLLLCADAAWSTRAWREQRAPSWLARSLFHDWPAYLRTLAGLGRVGHAEGEPVAIVPSHCLAALAAWRERPA